MFFHKQNAQYVVSVEPVGPSTARRVLFNSIHMVKHQVAHGFIFGGMRSIPENELVLMAAVFFFMDRTSCEEC